MTPHHIDPEIRKLVGDVDWDPAEIAERYAHERDIRLRPEKMGQYVETAGDFAHYADDPYVEAQARAPLFDHTEVVIIGGGVGGLMSGVRLRKQGVTDIRIIEKGGDLGGTWYWNRYPGIRCDTESYVYMPLIEEIGQMPTEKYARGDEIRAHLQKIAHRFGLYDKVCTQTGVTGLRWDEPARRWHIATDRGDDMTATFVIMANGILHKPKLPGIPGIGRFAGHTFHTSRWDYGYTGGDQTGGLTKLADKRVGIVGTGATGLQCIPVLGEYAQHLFVFQRTPAAPDIRANAPTDPDWAGSLQPGWQEFRVNNFNHITRGIEQDVDLVMDKFSEVGRLLDTQANWAAKRLGRVLTPEEGNYITDILDDRKMNEIRARIDAEVIDPVTAAALKPWHRRWCMRPNFSDDYLPTFNRPNVTLVDTAGKGITRITESAVVVGDAEYELDCLIFATGFEVGTEYTRRAGYEVVGRDGRELGSYWKDGMKTLHGAFVDGFPNCFLVGFGQNASATSFAYLLDEGAKHVAHVIGETRRRGARTVEPTPRAVRDYVAEVRPMSVSQLKFWRDCTPSYFTGEGQTDNPHGFFANVHPLGTIGFYKMLADWREANDLVGLQLSD